MVPKCLFSSAVSYLIISLKHPFPRQWFSNPVLISGPFILLKINEAPRELRFMWAASTLLGITTETLCLLIHSKTTVINPFDAKGNIFMKSHYMCAKKDTFTFL